MVAEVLGFDISTNDATTFKFLSVYAQERSDSIVSPFDRVVIRIQKSKFCSKLKIFTSKEKTDRVYSVIHEERTRRDRNTSKFFI